MYTRLKKMIDELNENCEEHFVLTVVNKVSVMVFSDCLSTIFLPVYLYSYWINNYFQDPNCHSSLYGSRPLARSLFYSNFLTKLQENLKTDDKVRTVELFPFMLNKIPVSCVSFRLFQEMIYMPLVNTGKEAYEHKMVEPVLYGKVSKNWRCLSRSCHLCFVYRW